MHSDMMFFQTSIIQKEIKNKLVFFNTFSATEELDTENEFLLPPVFGEEYEEQPRPRSKKKVMISSY